MSFGVGSQQGYARVRRSTSGNIKITPLGSSDGGESGPSPSLSPNFSSRRKSSAAIAGLGTGSSRLTIMEFGNASTSPKGGSRRSKPEEPEYYGKVSAKNESRIDDLVDSFVPHQSQKRRSSVDRSLLGKTGDSPSSASRRNTSSLSPIDSGREVTPLKISGSPGAARHSIKSVSPSSPKGTMASILLSDNDSAETQARRVRNYTQMRQGRFNTSWQPKPPVVTRTVEVQCGTPRINENDEVDDKDKNGTIPGESQSKSIFNVIGDPGHKDTDPVSLQMSAALKEALDTESTEIFPSDGMKSPQLSPPMSPLSPDTPSEVALLAKRKDDNANANANADEESDNQHAGSMFQGMADAVVASEWDSKYHTKWRVRGRMLMKSKSFNAIIAISTIYAIVGMELAEASVGSRDFLILSILTFAALLFFSFEIVVSSFCIEYYNLSFFWWLDFIGTVSLLPDIDFIWPDAWSLDGLALARAGRVARTGTKAIRVVRFFRIVRMLRLFRIVKLIGKAKGSDDDDGTNENDDVPENKTEAEMKSYRSRLAKRHAAVVEMRVVTGVILMLLVMPNLEFTHDDNSIFMGLEMLHMLVETSASNSTIDGVAEVYKMNEATLVTLSVGRFFFKREPIKAENVISTEADFTEGNWGNVKLAEYDLTEEIMASAWLNIGLTMFLSFLFALGSFVFNNDAHELMFQPFARLTQVTSKVSNQLFSVDADAINGSESAYIESVLTKIARFFDTDMHKVTTLYTPDNAVWTIDVRREKEEIARVVGSTHRITLGDLQNMCNGDKQVTVQRLMFKDFLSDPLAIRYFHTFLELESERTGGKSANDDNSLMLYEEIQRFRRSMSSSTFHARRIFKNFVDPEGETPVDLDNTDLIEAMFDEIIKHR